MYKLKLLVLLLCVVIVFGASPLGSGAVSVQPQLFAEFGYKWIGDFHNGLASAIKDGKYGYIDRAGRPVTSFVYDIAENFNNGFAVVIKLVTNQKGIELMKYGYVNTDGIEIIPCIYDMVDPVQSNGMVKVQDFSRDPGYNPKYSCYYNGDCYENSAKGVIHINGDIVLPVIYDDIMEFQCGLAAVKKGGKWSRSKITGGKWGYADTKGDIVIPFQYEDVGYDKGPFMSVKKRLPDGTVKWGVIDTAGNRPFLSFIMTYICSTMTGPMLPKTEKNTDLSTMPGKRRFLSYIAHIWKAQCISRTAW